MSWECPAIDNGVSIFSDGKIRPCCQVAAEYSKPITSILDPERFSDLKLEEKPAACKSCWQLEDLGIPSARKFYFNKQKQSLKNIQFLDFRHNNLCNLKCRYCGPHFSSQWAKELQINPQIKKVDILGYSDLLFTDALTDIYWCGGEPLILEDHYIISKTLINQNLSKNIDLRYNTNLTNITFKDIKVTDLWKEFKSVTVDVSLDAAGPEINSIRSGSDWDKINKNIETIMNCGINNLKIRLTPVVSILNIWFLPALVEYAVHKNIPIIVYPLTGPDYLSLSVLPKNLKEIATEIIETNKDKLINGYEKIIHILNHNNESLFDHAIRHILLLDSLRNEKLFHLLPFKQDAVDSTLKNYEYK